MVGDVVGHALPGGGIQFQQRNVEGDVQERRCTVCRHHTDSLGEIQEFATEFELFGVRRQFLAARVELGLLGGDIGARCFQLRALGIQLGLLLVQRGNLRGRSACCFGLLPGSVELLLRGIELALPALNLSQRGIQL